MKLKISIDENDLFAFTLYHYANSPSAKRLQRNNQWMATALVFLMVSLSGFLMDMSLLIIIAVPLAFWSYFSFPRIMKKKILKQTAKMLDEGSNKTLLGTHELIIDDDSILIKSDLSESRIMFSGIDRIASSPDYTFLYVSSMSAIPIPRGSILEGDYESFTAMLKNRITDR